MSSAFIHLCVCLWEEELVCECDEFLDSEFPVVSMKLPVSIVVLWYNNDIKLQCSWSKKCFSHLKCDWMSVIRAGLGHKQSVGTTLL